MPMQNFLMHAKVINFSIIFFKEKFIQTKSTINNKYLKEKQINMFLQAKNNDEQLLDIFCLKKSCINHHFYSSTILKRI